MSILALSPSFPLKKLLAGKAEPHEVCCFVRLQGNGHTAENFAALVPWKWASVDKPRLVATLRERAGTLELVVKNTNVVPFFHAELAKTEGHFQGDWQVLRPGTHIFPYVFHTDLGQAKLSLSEAKKRLSVSSLFDLSDR